MRNASILYLAVVTVWDGAFLPPLLFYKLGHGSHGGSCREVKSVFVETALSDDGMLASDHRPVVADVLIR
jgi:hypothetical protein